MSPRVHDPERWRILEDIFQAACDLSEVERKQFLDSSCANDPSLRDEVESLLASANEPAGFLQRPIADAAQSVVPEIAPGGKRIGPYEISALLGEGGMGRVYLARRADQVYSQSVAIKYMRADFGSDPQMLLRFRMERQILANLNHTNVAQLLDGGVTPEGLPWLALEYVDGIPIDEYCRRNHLALHARLELFLTVCSAIEYAHRNLVIHRDIKPANVLVTSEGIPKLLDFGIAKLLSPDFADSVRTRASERLMTPEYASPEQVRGDAVTTATDVYALGVLLYELLAGRRPFHLKTDSPFEIARVICEEMPTAPSAARSNEPDMSAIDARRLKGDLDTVVLMAMRKEPERRYSSVAQFASDIRAYLDGYPLVARGDTWGYRTCTFVKRHKAAVASAAIAAVALAGFGIGMGVLAKRAERERQTAHREAQFLAGMFRAATPDEAQGQTVTARTLLDRGALRINRDLSAEPAVRASLLETIAEAYRSLGVFDRSRDLAQQSLTLAKASQGDDSPEARQSTELLAELDRDAGRYAEAEPLFHQLIASRRKQFPRGDPESARLMAELGECLYWQAKDDDAISLLRETLAMDRKNGPDYGADTRNYLALALERKGSFEEAHQLLQEAVDINRRTSGPDSPPYAISLQNLGSSLIDRGDLYGSETKLREVLQIQRRILGPEHPGLAYVLNNLGFVLVRTGQARAAEPFLLDVIDIQSKSLGPKNPRLAGPMNNLALAYDEEGNYTQARATLENILAIMNAANAGKTWPAAQIMSSLALVEFDQGHYRIAEEKARASMELKRQLGGDGTPQFADSLLRVADIRLYQGDARTAESLLRQALDIRRKRYWPGNPDIAAAETRLGEVLLVEKEAAQAEPILRHATDSLDHPAFRVPAWQTADTRAAYGVCLRMTGRATEGDSLINESRSDLKSHPRANLRGDPVARIQKLSSLWKP